MSLLVYYRARITQLHIWRALQYRHMCNLHIKETEISQKRSKGIKNWKITYSVILSVLWNKTNLVLGFSSPLSSQNSPEKLVTFSQSYLCCYLPSEDGRHGNNELINIGLFLYFSYFFYNFSSFLRWKCFKICTGEDIDLTLLIPYFLKILWSKFYDIF